MKKTETKTNSNLVAVVKESGLDATKAKIILKQFSDYFDIAADWELKAKAIVVTDESQKAEMQMAKVGRLFLRDKRFSVEKTRKELKEQSLREGKAIDGIANVLKSVIVPIEKYLEKQEKFVEIKEAEEQERLRIELAAEQEKERLEKEKAEAEEQERMKEENERLAREAEELEKKLQAQKDKVEAEKKKVAAEKKKVAAEKEKVQTEKKKVKVEKEKVVALKAEKSTVEKTGVKVTCPHCKKTFNMPVKL